MVGNPFGSILNTVEGAAVGAVGGVGVSKLIGGKASGLAGNQQKQPNSASSMKATKVTIESDSETIVITNPNVISSAVNGMETFSIVGGSVARTPNAAAGQPTQ